SVHFISNWQALPPKALSRHMAVSMAPLTSSPVHPLRSSDARDYEIRKMIAKMTKIVESMAPLMSSPMDSLRSSDVRDYEIRKMIAKITKIVERFLRHLIPEEKKEKVKFEVTSFSSHLPKL
ncbi:hypothetical protein Ancab_038088, partial [Ancistrocladus abbreviatus]